MHSMTARISNSELDNFVIDDLEELYQDSVAGATCACISECRLLGHGATVATTLLTLLVPTHVCQLWPALFAGGKIQLRRAHLILLD